MPLSDVLKNLVGEIKEKVEEENKEPEPKGNGMLQLVSDDTEVENVYDPS